MVNDINTTPSEDKLPQTPLVYSADDTLPDPCLILFHETQFSTSNSTASVIHSLFTSILPTLLF